MRERVYAGRLGVSTWYGDAHGGEEDVDADHHDEEHRHRDRAPKHAEPESPPLGVEPPAQRLVRFQAGALGLLRVPEEVRLDPGDEAQSVIRHGRLEGIVQGEQSYGRADT